MTYFLPVESVTWYVGFDWPYPNCSVNASSVDRWTCDLAEERRRAYLLDLNGHLDLRHVGFDVALEGLDIDWLPNGTCHCVCSQATCPEERCCDWSKN